MAEHRQRQRHEDTNRGKDDAKYEDTEKAKADTIRAARTWTRTRQLVDTCKHVKEKDKNTV